MFCRPCFNRFGGLKYIPRLFSEYMLTFRVEEPMKICVKTKFVILTIVNIHILYNQIATSDRYFSGYKKSVVTYLPSTPKKNEKITGPRIFQAINQ